MVPNCAICDRESKSFGSLVKHFCQSHSISVEDYYVKYLGSKNSCKYCGSKDVTFLSIGEGFNNHCKACKRIHSVEVAKEKRSKLAKDLVAEKLFRERLASSVSKSWDKRPRKEIKRKFMDDDQYERLSIRTAKTYRLPVDFSKPVSQQIDLLVANNLTALFGL